MNMSDNISAIVRVIASAATGSVVGVLAVIFWIAMQEDTTLSPAANYGPENTWYHMVFHDKTNYEGHNGTDMTLVLGGTEQNECNDLRSYRDVSDGKSVKFYDNANPDEYIAEGTKIYLYWGRRCPSYKPYGVITVPANVKEVKVPDLNKSSTNYEVFNNFDSEDRVLAGHIFGVKWSAP